MLTTQFPNYIELTKSQKIDNTDRQPIYAKFVNMAQAQLITRIVLLLLSYLFDRYHNKEKKYQGHFYIYSVGLYWACCTQHNNNAIMMYKTEMLNNKHRMFIYTWACISYIVLYNTYTIIHKTIYSVCHMNLFMTHT